MWADFWVDARVYVDILLFVDVFIDMCMHVHMYMGIKAIYTCTHICINYRYMNNVVCIGMRIIRIKVNILVKDTCAHVRSQCVHVPHLSLDRREGLKREASLGGTKMATRRQASWR